MIDNYVNKARQEGITTRKFVYDYNKYKADLEQKTILETNFES